MFITMKINHLLIILITLFHTINQCTPLLSLHKSKKEVLDASSDHKSTTTDEEKTKVLDKTKKIKELLSIKVEPSRILGANNAMYVPKYAPILYAEQQAEQVAERFGKPGEYVEGDIKKSSLENLKRDGFTNLRDIVLKPKYKWKTTRIPYQIDPALNDREKHAIESAIKDFKDYTCVRLHPRTDETDYINFVKDVGCWSYLGRQGGKQDISIGTGCGYKGTVIHELMHTLGFFHEHTRSDRDDYIKIKKERIEDGKLIDFEKYGSYEVPSKFDFPYDYDSITQYGPQTFSKNFISKTIEPIDPVKQDVSLMGQRAGFSITDVKRINKMFCEKRTIDDDNTKTTETSGSNNTVETTKKTSDVTKVPLRNENLTPFNRDDIYINPRPTGPMSTDETRFTRSETPVSYAPYPDQNIISLETSFKTTPKPTDSITFMPATSTKAEKIEINIVPTAATDIIMEQNKTNENSTVGSNSNGTFPQTSNSPVLNDPTLTKPSTSPDTVLPFNQKQYVGNDYPPEEPIPTPSVTPKYAPTETTTPAKQLKLYPIDTNKDNSTTGITGTVSVANISLTPTEVNMDRRCDKEGKLQNSSNLHDCNPTDYNNNNQEAVDVLKTVYDDLHNRYIQVTKPIVPVLTTASTPIKKTLKNKQNSVKNKQNSEFTNEQNFEIELPSKSMKAGDTNDDEESIIEHVEIDSDKEDILTNSNQSISVNTIVDRATRLNNKSSDKPLKISGVLRSNITTKDSCTNKSEYPCWPDDYLWSYQGLPYDCNCGKAKNETCHCNCVRFRGTDNEDGGWSNNYLCYKEKKENPSFIWSVRGGIPGLKCLHITEPKEPSGWLNNYLCMSRDIPYNLQWSNNGAIKDKSCIRIHEPRDEIHGWDNNYLCG